MCCWDTILSIIVDDSCDYLGKKFLEPTTVNFRCKLCIPVVFLCLNIFLSNMYNLMSFSHSSKTELRIHWPLGFVFIIDFIDYNEI
jgi:hypothetical protein